MALPSPLRSGTQLLVPDALDPTELPVPSALPVTPPSEAERAARNPFTQGLRTAALGMSAGDTAQQSLEAELSGKAAQASALRQQALEQSVLAQQAAPAINSYTQVHGVGDALDYAAGAVGQAIPTMVPSIAGALLLRGRGNGLISRGMSYAGAYGPAYLQERNEAVLNQAQDPAQMAQPPELRQQVARSKGGVNAALESIVPAALGHGFFRPGSALRTIANSATTEFGTEAAQEKVGQIAQSYLNPQRDTSQDNQNILDAGLQGAIGGGGVSTPTALSQAAASALQASGNKALELGKAGGKKALEAGQAVSDKAQLPERTSDLMDKMFRAADSVDLDKLKKGVMDPALAAGKDFAETIQNMNLREQELPQIADRVLKSLKEKAPKWAAKVDPNNPDSLVTAVKNADWSAKLDKFKTDVTDGFAAGKAFAAERAGKKNLMELDPAMRGDLQQLLFENLNPDLQDVQSVRDALPSMAVRLAALSARVGDLDKSDVEAMTDLSDTFRSMFPDPQGVASKLKQYVKNSDKSLLDKILSIESATSDARQPGSFLELSLSEKARKAGWDMAEVGKYVDKAVVDPDNANYGILRNLFGSTAKANQVLDYYQGKMAEQGIELDQEPGGNDFERRAEAINPLDMGADEGPRYFFQNTRSQTPFSRGKRVTDKEGKQVFETEASRRKLAGVLKQARDAGGDVSSARPQVIGYGEYAREQGLDPEARRAHFTKLAEKRRTAALKKGQKLKAEGGTEAALQAERQKVMDANRELKYLKTDAPADEVLDHLFQVVKINRADGNAETIDSHDLHKMGQILRERPKDADKLAANKATKISFVTPDGRKVDLSAEGIARTMMHRGDRVVGVERTHAQKYQQAFADGVAALMAQGYQLAEGQDINKAVVNRAGKVVAEPELEQVELPKQGKSPSDFVLDTAENAKAIERQYKNRPLSLLEGAHKSYMDLNAQVGVTRGPAQARLKTRRRLAREIGQNALRKVFPLPERPVTVGIDREQTLENGENRLEELQFQYLRELEQLKNELSDAEDDFPGFVGFYLNEVQDKIDEIMAEGVDAPRMFEEDTGLAVGSEKGAGRAQVSGDKLGGRPKVARPDKVRANKARFQAEKKLDQEAREANAKIGLTKAEKLTAKAKESSDQKAELRAAKKEAVANQKSRTPEFDKLPAHDPNHKTMTYAGVGSRQTPPEILAKMTAVAKRLEQLGYTLRTGDASGADAAFRAGTAKKEVFAAKDATDTTRQIAIEIHPAPQALRSPYVLNLMARNTNQVFGKGLDTPADFVIVWTKDGSETSRGQGGTGQAMDMALRKGIPVINAAKPGWELRLKKLLAEKKSDSNLKLGSPDQTLFDIVEATFDTDTLSGGVAMTMTAIARSLSLDGAIPSSLLKATRELEERLKASGFAPLVEAVRKMPSLSGLMQLLLSTELLKNSEDRRVRLGAQVLSDAATNRLQNRKLGSDDPRSDPSLDHTVPQEWVKAVFASLPEESEMLSVMFGAPDRTAPASEYLRSVRPLATPAQRRMIDSLLKLGTLDEVMAAWVAQDDERADGLGGLGGVYNPHDNTVQLVGIPNGQYFTDPIKTIIHESAHAVTMRAEATNVEFRRDVQRMLLAARKGLAGRYDVTKIYGLTDTQEFIAEAFSNQKFQEMLASLPAINTESFKNLWEEFKNFIAKLLGVQRDPTLLDEALTVGFGMARELKQLRTAMGAALTDKRPAGEDLKMGNALASELFENNGSGDSSASIEAINRNRDEKAAGQTRVLIDRDGQVHELEGVDAVDTHARAGQIILQRGVGAGEWTMLSRGADVSRDAAVGRANAAGMPLTVAYNSQTGGAEGNTLSAEDQATLIADLQRQRGPELKVIFDDFFKVGGSGSYTYDPPTGERTIKIALQAMNPSTVGWHEALHDFFQLLGGDKSSTKMRKEIEAVASSQPVIRQLRELLKDHPAALAQIETDAEERAAYAYQFFLQGMIRLGPDTSTLFGKIHAFLAKILHTISTGARVEQYLAALYQGHMADPSVVSQVAAALQAKSPTYADRMQGLSNMLGNVGEKIFASSIERLDNTNIRALSEIGEAHYQPPDKQQDKSLPFLPRRSMARGVWTNKFFKILEGHTHDELKAALTNLQSMDRSGALESQIGALLDEMYDYQQVAGVKNVVRRKDKTGEWETVEEAIPKIDNYFPRVWDLDVIRRDPASFVTDLINHGGLTQKAAERVMNGLATMAPSDKIDIDTADTSYVPYNQSTMNREFDFIDASNAQFFSKYQSQDLGDVLYTYVDQAVHRAEYARQFGNQGQWLEAKLEEARQQGATPADLAMARAAVKGMDGTLGLDMNPKLRQWMTGIITAENLILLPLALFSQVVDAVAIGARANSFKESLNALDRGFREVVKSFTKHADEFSKDERLAMDLGIIDETAMLEAMGMTYQGMYMTKRLRNINRKFFRINRMEQWNRAMRVQGMVTGQRFILANKDNPRYMDELGLSSADIRELPDGNLAVTELDGLTAAQARKMRTALFKFTDSAVLRPNAAHRPIWGNDPRFMLLIHLKQFSYSFQNVILKNMKKELKFGNAKPAMVLLGAIPLIMISDLLKNASTGNLDANLTFGQALAHGVARSGLLGTKAFYTDAGSDLAHGHMPGVSFLGPTFEHALTITQGILGVPGTDPADVITRSVPAGALIRNFTQ